MSIESSTERIWNINYWLIVLIVSLLDFAATFGVSNVLWSDTIYQMNFEGVDFAAYLKSVRSIDLFRYCLTPFYVMAKSFAISTILSVAFKITNHDVDFVDLLKVSLIAEFTLIAADLFKVFWFIVIMPDYGSEDLKGFSPLSLAQLFHGIEVWEQYPLKMASLFQLAYAILLGYGVKKVAENKEKVMGTTIMVYTSIWLFWVIVKLFFWTMGS